MRLKDLKQSLILLLISVLHRTLLRRQTHRSHNGPESHLTLQFLQVADPRLARLSLKQADSDDEEVAAPRIVSRRQARDDSDAESQDEEQASGMSSEQEEDDEGVEARRAAVRAR